MTNISNPIRSRLLDQDASEGWFPAGFSGTCEHCDRRFKPGTAIRLTAASGWRWQAECCADGRTRR
jgi:hypothetical protein